MTGALLAYLLALAPQGSSPPVQLWDEVRSDRVCTMTGSWMTGLGSPRPVIAAVSIERVTVAGRALLQASHRNAPPAPAGYDRYLVDAGTLQGVETQHNGMEPPVHFRINGLVAQKLFPSGAAQETIVLPNYPMPEGPGLEIIAQAINWRDGLTLRSVMLDRWRGTKQLRVRDMTWTVTGRERRKTLGGQQEVFRTLLSPQDGSFSIVAFITTARPHHIVRYEYQSQPDRPVVVSEMRDATFRCNK